MIYNFSEMKDLPILILLASLLFGACSDKLVEQDTSVTLPDITVNITEDVTRTYVEGKALHWNAADEISIFYGSTINSKYEFQGNDGDTGGTFSFVSGSGSGSELSSIYAVYPYQSGAAITDAGVISLTLPSMQQYVANSFGKGANTMIGVSEDKETNSISFKNACGYLKLRLYGNITVKTITLKGNDGEKIAGAATATMTYGDVPELSMSVDDATKSVTINCGDGVTLGTTSETATEFWFVLPNIDFTEGITIEVINTDGDIFGKSTSNPVSITRNEIQPMVALEIKEEESEPAGNEIRYTSTDNNLIWPDEDKFDEEIVSNEYVNGQGVITFGDVITSIKDSAFKDRELLTTIRIPAGVLTIGDYAFSGCDELTTVYCLADSPPTIGLDTFGSIYNIPEDFRIYVPSGSVDSYRTRTYWSEYASYIFGFQTCIYLGMTKTVIPICLMLDELDAAPVVDRIMTYISQS